MKEERLQILRMIQEGIISAEDGAKLLAALGSDEPREAPTHVSSPVSTQRRWLRIRVSDRNGENARVNLTLPLSLLDWGLRLAEGGVGLNLAAVRDVIRGGAEGKILEVDESESGERVEIFVE
ncbi:MAG TPA: hypothetical protein VF707_02920 [Ardenticatenaceae bacterium]|jgi:hypothetical protein